MLLAAEAAWSLWVRIPAYVIGGVLFAGGAIVVWPLVARPSDREQTQGFFLAQLLVFAGVSYFAAWDERNVLAAFVGELLAHSFGYGGVLTGCLAGWWVGHRTYEASKSEDAAWNTYEARKSERAAWIAGVATALVVAALLNAAGRVIPGVAWRMDRIADSEPYDPGHI